MFYMTRVVTIRAGTLSEIQDIVRLTFSNTHFCTVSEICFYFHVPKLCAYSVPLSQIHTALENFPPHCISSVAASVAAIEMLHSVQKTHISYAKLICRTNFQFIHDYGTTFCFDSSLGWSRRSIAGKEMYISFR